MKPDRWERISRECIDEHFNNLQGCPKGCRQHAEVIAKLLRAQHRAVMRMVRNQKKVSGYVDDFVDRKILLTKLKEFAK